jgi:aryl-alcohol dehydrogenase-like predicted oxidoreductase
MIARRSMGHSGLQVSALALGAMTFATSGPYADIAASETDRASLIDLAREHGIDTFDTANVYGAGDSETLLGKLLGTRRHAVVISTKIRFASEALQDKRPPFGSAGLSRQAILHGVEASLTRLDTDYIDILHLHMQDRSVPIDETLRALDDLVTQGKVRYLGVSNFMAYRLVEALWRAEALQTVPIVSLQLPWSLLNRDVERELIPAARHFQLGVMVYSPLARGFLSGKYARTAPPPEDSRLARWREEWHACDQARSWGIVDALEGIARRREEPVAAVALAWVLARRPVASVILGARTPAQLRENLRAARLFLDAEELAELNRLSEPEWGYPCDFIKRFEAW